MCFIPVCFRNVTESNIPDVYGQGRVTVLQPGLAQIEVLSQTGDYDLACVNACGSDVVNISRPPGVGAISV